MFTSDFGTIFVVIGFLGALLSGFTFTEMRFRLGLGERLSTLKAFLVVATLAIIGILGCLISRQ